MRDVQATGEALSPALQKHEIFSLTFSIFVGRFWPHNQCGSMRFLIF
jgi:hypothetical protein